MFYFYLGIIYGFVSHNEYNKSNIKEFQLVEIVESNYNSDLINELKTELAFANIKIEKYENEMQLIKEQIKKPYPNVKFLNCRSKKHILV